MDSILLVHTFQVLFVFPYKSFAAFYQPEVLKFQRFILCVKRMMIGLELLIGCTKLGEVLIPSLNEPYWGGRKRGARFQSYPVQR